MREILFRGKRTDNGEWVEGYYYKAKYCRTDDELCDYITVPHPKEYNEPSSHYIVNPETVGQYTGLKDKNGIKIFESDIVNCKTINYFFGNCKVVYRNSLARYCIISADGLIFPMEEESFEYEVVGNVHDNPELLGGNR